MKHMACLVLDPADSKFEVNTDITVAIWKEFYPSIKEDLLKNMPPPKGKAVHVSSYSDASYKNDKISL